jgi:hypothetical protein
LHLLGRAVELHREDAPDDFTASDPLAVEFAGDLGARIPVLVAERFVSGE